jgi:hypothetical protein
VLIHLTLWQRFQLWAEDGATQLGMDLATYYAICALNGAYSGWVISSCLGLV